MLPCDVSNLTIVPGWAGSEKWVERSTLVLASWATSTLDSGCVMTADSIMRDSRYSTGAVLGAGAEGFLRILNMPAPTVRRCCRGDRKRTDFLQGKHQRRCAVG